MVALAAELHCFRWSQLPLPNMPAYSASKAALAAFANAVRPELALSGIHLAQVQPGELSQPSAGAGQTIWLPNQLQLDSITLPLLLLARPLTERFQLSHTTRALGLLQAGCARTSALPLLLLTSTGTVTSAGCAACLCSSACGATSAAWALNALFVAVGVINSDFLERAQWRGEAAKEAQQQLEKLLQSSLFVQTPQQVTKSALQRVVI